MGQLEGSIVLQGDMNAATLTARGGKHGEDKFDANGRRKADSIIHEQILRYEQVSGTAVVAESRVAAKSPNARRASSRCAWVMSLSRVGASRSSRLRSDRD